MKLCIKVVKGKPQGQILQFPKGEFMFGRGPECDVRPNSDLISRQHCLLQITDDGASIRDVGSRNGTLVNGQLVIGARKLMEGDTVQLGPLVLEIHMDLPLNGASVSTSETALVDRDDTRLRETALQEPIVHAEQR